jgi:hypothetical protein
MKRISLPLFVSIISMQYAEAQIPSDPMFTKDDSLRAVQGHQPGRGFSIIERKEGSLVFSAYASVRYLNQSGLEDTYTDYFGRTSAIKKRNDLQFQKVMLISRVGCLIRNSGICFMCGLQIQARDKRRR